MTTEPGKDATTLEKALLRLEALTGTLQTVADPHARDAARELLELLLDLHGLALARMTSLVATAENGSALVERLIADRHICAILLLHGLHPHDAETRLNQAIGRMHQQWAERGFQVDLLSVGTAAARVRLYKNGSSEPVDELRREVEDVLAEAVPDLDDILVEIEVAGAAGAAGAVGVTGLAGPALQAD
jgi:hypothetical protein